MNKFTSLCVAAGAGSLLLAGCATAPVTHVDPDSSRTVLSMGQISMQDWNKAAEDVIKKMQDEFINPGKLQSADGPDKPSVMAVSRIVNNTGLQINSEKLVKRIRIALLQTGKVLTDVTAGLGGPEDPLADANKRQEIFTGSRKLRLADYTLSGRIFEDKLRAGNVHEVNYFFHLTLSTAGGLAVWEGETRITKQGRKPSVGW